MFPHKIFAAILTAMTFHGAAFATQPTASGSGIVAIQNVVKGNIALGTNGTSTSNAQNNESGMANVTATANYLPCYQAVNTGIAGETLRKSSDSAFNTSTGSGAGSATSRGNDLATVRGQAAIHDVTESVNGGKSLTDTHNRVVADTNQGSYFGAENKSGVDLQLHYEAQSRNPVATAVAPALTSSNDTCMGSVSMGASAVSFGLSVGSRWTDNNCLMLKNAREIWNMGFKGAALVRLCMDALNKEAFEATGIRCPERQLSTSQSASQSASEIRLSDAAGSDNPYRYRCLARTINTA